MNLNSAEWKLAVALELLNESLDPDPCELDHNRDCQAHDYFPKGDEETECPVFRARRFLQENGYTPGGDGS